MADWDDLRAEARELETDDRIRRINQSRGRQAAHGPPGDAPEFICAECGQDGDCDCPPEKAEQPPVVRPTRHTEKEQPEELWNTLTSWPLKWGSGTAART
jgi:hypothetical protein